MKSFLSAVYGNLPSICWPAENSIDVWRLQWYLSSPSDFTRTLIRSILVTGANRLDNEQQLESTRLESPTRYLVLITFRSTEIWAEAREREKYQKINVKHVSCEGWSRKSI